MISPLIGPWLTAGPSPGLMAFPVTNAIKGIACCACGPPFDGAGKRDRRPVRKALGIFATFGEFDRRSGDSRQRSPGLVPTQTFRCSMPTLLNPAAIWPIVLLSLSNVFMTFAWYGHLKFRHSAIFAAILVSWGIAFFEYCLAVPANRIGAQVYSAAQLKTMQEVITLLVFSGFSVFWLKESLTWGHAAGFALIALGASLIFRA